ncbi:extracellular solute-binding protein [Clostridiaceae bacterium M8S5]|nr:extracellular solute-binding protein [Clostridiaceae bacterium M8S5]
MDYKTINIIIIFVIILSLCGCSLSQESVYDELSKEIKSNKKSNDNITLTGELNKEKNLSGTLTITTLLDDYINIHAKNFMKLHPDVKIIFKTSDENQFETLEMYSNRVSVELMSGTASDVVDLANLDINRYAKSELLCNLYEFMNDDTSFNKSDYYDNIFKAMEYENALYAIPFVFCYDMVYVSKPIVNKMNINIKKNLDGINYITMLDIFKKVKKEYKTPQEFELMPGAVKEIFFKHECVEFYDTGKGTCFFDSEKFLQFLNLTNSIKTKYNPKDQSGWNMIRVYDGNDDFMKSKFLFSKFESNAIDLYNMMIVYENILGPIPFINSKNNATFETFSSTYGIPKNSKNKKLAWEFIKYCISAKEITEFKSNEEEHEYFMMYQGWIPINIENFYSSFRFNFKKEIKRLAGNDIKWKKGKRDELINNILDQIHKWNLGRNKLVLDFDLWTLSINELKNYYYYNLSTDKETAKIIQNKVSTYLNE